MADIPLWFQLSVVFVLGSCIGSFLNVCIYRIPREQSIVTPRSHCSECQHILYWYHNIPLLSYLFLRGRCHFCKKRYSSRYLIVELLTASLLCLLYLFSFTTPSPYLFFSFFSFFTCGLIVATFIDIDFLIIPDTISVGGIPLGIAASCFLPFMMGQTTPLWGGLMSLFGALFGGSLLLLIAFFGAKVFKKEAMGMGDIKLMAAIGAFLGLKKVCLTLFFGSIAGSIIGIILILGQKAGWKSQIPFGPYLALGALLALFFGDALWGWYFNF